MELKQLGPTPVQIPAIGFGTWRYAGGIEPLRAALDCGASFLDTAETYGTEELVGEAIRNRRQDVFLATKVAPRNFRRADLIRAAENSLRRLQTDYIDLYQLHWPNVTVPVEESMAAMEELVDCGKIRFIGVSNFSGRYLRRAQRALSKHKIVSNQVRYSLIDRSIENGLLPYCQANNVTIMAYSPLGLNFSRIVSADPGRVLSQVAAAAAKSEAQVALNWVIAKPNVVAIAKASSVAHAIDDCDAAGWRLSAEHYMLLDREIRCRRRGSAYALVQYCHRYLKQSLGRSLC